MSPSRWDTISTVGNDKWHCPDLDRRRWMPKLPQWDLWRIVLSLTEMLPTPLKSSPLWWGAIPKGAFLHIVTHISHLCQFRICLQKVSCLVIQGSPQPRSAFPLHLHNAVTAIPTPCSSNSTTCPESISSHLWYFLLCCYFSSSGKHVKYTLYGGGDFNSNYTEPKDSSFSQRQSPQGEKERAGREPRGWTVDGL